MTLSIYKRSKFIFFFHVSFPMIFYFSYYQKINSKYIFLNYCRIVNYLANENKFYIVKSSLYVEKILDR